MGKGCGDVLLNSQSDQAETWWVGRYLAKELVHVTDGVIGKAQK